MKKIFRIFTGAALIMLAACSSLQVSYDYDKNADFSKYKTFEYYGWADNSDQILTPFDKERIEAAFYDELQKRGLELVKENGDAVISLFIVVNEKTGVTAYTDHYGAGYGGYHGFGYGPGWGWGYGSSTTRYHEYDYSVGTLVMDFFDKEAKKLVWQGVATKTVDDDKSSAVREKSIKKVATAIMSNFPVPPQK